MKSQRSTSSTAPSLHCASHLDYLQSSCSASSASHCRKMHFSSTSAWLQGCSLVTQNKNCTKQLGCRKAALPYIYSSLNFIYLRWSQEKLQSVLGDSACVEWQDLEPGSALEPKHKEVQGNNCNYLQYLHRVTGTSAQNLNFLLHPVPNAVFKSKTALHKYQWKSIHGPWINSYKSY